MRYYGHDGPVLEVGAGHRPYPVSDVLVDKYIENNQREGDLRTGGRPLIICGLENLPFADNSFAYAIAAHVIEHVPDPAIALRELARVARAGYIETPSALMELVEPHRTYHLWSVLCSGGELVFLPKDPAACGRHQDLTNRLITSNIGWKFFAAGNPRLFTTSLEWRDRIPFRIEERSFHPDEYLSLVEQGPAAWAANLVRKAGTMLARRLPRSLFGRRPAALMSMLRCPRCHGPLKLDPTRLRCAPCAGGYPHAGGRYFLSPDRFVAD